MTWFAAHVITYFAFKDGRHETYRVWENVILVQADTEEAARAKAEVYGRESEGDDEGTLRWAQRPATSVFAGVRKVIRCDSDTEQPGDGTEITYSEIVVDTLDAVRDLAAGRPMPLKQYD
jgi:hypothetical protein